MADLYERFVVGDDSSREHDGRSPVAKDRDRIIHSSAFRRLQGKSQIVGVDVGDFFRTRLTHSLECAQIGRAIASIVAEHPDSAADVEDVEDLPDLVEAACLGHDLGHAPFGHNGERALQSCMRDYNESLFEGNAQSFRVVTFFEPKRQGQTSRGRWRWAGLDLTRTTLRALMKYPRVETKTMLTDDAPKFGVYDDPDDREYFEWVWDGDAKDTTLAAKIMDAADDIAYAVHDFEDGVWAGMIPLYELLSENPRRLGELEERILPRDRDRLFRTGAFAETISDLFASESLGYLRDGPFDRTRYARAALKDFTAQLIDDFVRAVTSGSRFRELEPALRRRMLVLKEMAALWMIERSDIETYRFGQRKLIRRLFEGYWKNPAMLPMRDDWSIISRNKPGRRVRDRLRRKETRWPQKARFVRDHIAGMTDGYARDVYDEMYRATQHRDLRLAY